jgi:hypothetical protein
MGWRDGMVSRVKGRGSRYGRKMGRSLCERRVSLRLKPERYSRPLASCDAPQNLEKRFATLEDV